MSSSLLDDAETTPAHLLTNEDLSGSALPILQGPDLNTILSLKGVIRNPYIQEVLLEIKRYMEQEMARLSNELERKLNMLAEVNEEMAALKEHERRTAQEAAAHSRSLVEDWLEGLRKSQVL